MPVSKGDKRAKATKSKSSTPKGKGSPSTSKVKKEGTRVGLMVDLRSAGKKKDSSAPSRNRLRDGR